MAARFLAELFTPEVLAAQERYTRRSWPQSTPDLLPPKILAAREDFLEGGRSASEASEGRGGTERPPAAEGRTREHDRLGPTEVEFISQRDSFYMATISSSGWPYVQHRGGPRGFLKVQGERTLTFADFRGNRQLISTGNLSHDGRVALILVDYPGRTRLKVLGHARVVNARDDPALTSHLQMAELGRKVERFVSIEVVGFDWNCPAYITQRYTVAEIEELVAPMYRRISELEAELARRSS